MQFKIAVAASGLVLAAVGLYGTSSSAEDVAPVEAPPQAQRATIVKTEVVRPKRTVHRRGRFAVPSWPTPSYVLNVIAPHEAALWGASLSTLQRRIRCESGGSPGAANGQYRGVGQFASGTFYRGMGTIGTRRVVIFETKYRRMHSRVYRSWSDGRRTRHNGRVVRQRVVVKRVGRISGVYPDAWSEVRIMAQANAGRSAVHDSEWSCR